MKLGKNEVLHVAKLARLTLAPSEIEKFEKQLSKVVSYISELNEVDTDNIEPTSQTTGLTNVFRNDRNPEESLGSEKTLSGSTKTHNGYFLVPRVISKKEE